MQKEDILEVPLEEKTSRDIIVFIVIGLIAILLVALIVLFFIYIIENNNIPPANLTANDSETNINNNFSVTNLTDINGTPINYTQNKTDPDDKDEIENETITSITCTNDTGCNSAGSFCDGNLIYTCALNSSDGCLDRVNGANCAGGEYCGGGSCVAVTGRIIYVDKDSLLTGQCNNNWAGNITNPKCTVTGQNWIMYGLLPGDLVYFVGNESTDYSYMYLFQNSSGTSGAPVIMRPYGDYTMKFNDVHGVRLYENTSYIKMFNLEFITYMALANNTGLEISNCTVNATSDSGIRLVDVNDFKLSDCVIHGRGYSLRSENIGVNIRGYSNNLLFENVEVYGINDGSSGPDNSDADGFSIGYGSTRNVTFINCSSHNNGEDGFDLTADAVLINCKAYNNEGAGVKVFRRTYDDYAMNSVTVINSLIYNNGYFAPDPNQGNPGIKSSGGGQLFVYNSAIYGNWDEGIGIRGYNTTADIAYSRVYNSIISNNGQEGIGVDQSAYPNPGFNNVSAGNNIYFNNSAANNGLQSDINSLNEDPLFIDSINFKLLAGSPGIDKGIDLSSILSQDIERKTRPQGAGWDIGAYEY